MIKDNCLERDLDIEEKARILLEELIELYRVNDPYCGESTELEKTNNAYKSIDIFWQLFDLLGFWAQCHLAAHARAYNDPEFAPALVEDHPDLHFDAHELEDIGNRFLFAISTDFDDEQYLQFIDDKEWLETAGRKNQIIRDLVVDLLSSRSPQSGVWRFPLLRALKALNAGQYDPILHPQPKRRVGRAFDLNQWKLEALLQIHYRVGSGWKKYRATELVAENIGQSVETLRDWEKDLKLDPDYEVEMTCASIAGRHNKKFKEGETIGFPNYGMHKGRELTDLARELLPHLEARSFEEIVENLRINRIKDAGG